VASDPAIRRRSSRGSVTDFTVPGGADMAVRAEPVVEDDAGEDAVPVEAA
jgi:hypothetical protein